MFRHEPLQVNVVRGGVEQRGNIAREDRDRTPVADDASRGCPLGQPVHRSTGPRCQPVTGHQKSTASPVSRRALGFQGAIVRCDLLRAVDQVLDRFQRIVSRALAISPHQLVSVSCRNAEPTIRLEPMRRVNSRNRMLVNLGS